MDVGPEIEASEFKIKADVEILEGKDYPWIIESVTYEDVSGGRGKPEMKICLWFKETDKKFPLNKTNLRQVADCVGSRETDDWVGRKIILYRTMTWSPIHKDNVPCIRIREKSYRLNEQQAATAAPSEGVAEDDIPF